LDGGQITGIFGNFSEITRNPKMAKFRIFKYGEKRLSDDFFPLFRDFGEYSRKLAKKRKFDKNKSGKNLGNLTPEAENYE